MFFNRYKKAWRKMMDKWGIDYEFIGKNRIVYTIETGSGHITKMPLRAKFYNLQEFMYSTIKAKKVYVYKVYAKHIEACIVYDV